MNDVNIIGTVVAQPAGKICPRFTAHDPISQSTLYFICRKGECSLWTGGSCADVLTAQALDRIAQVLEKRDRRGV